MPARFQSVPLVSADNQLADVQLATCVDTSAVHEASIQHAAGLHEFLITSRVLPGRRVVITSETTDNNIQYSEKNPPEEWPLEVEVSNAAKKVPRAAWLAHTTGCTPKNGHSVRIQVEIRTMFRDERDTLLGGTEMPYSLQFTC